VRVLSVWKEGDALLTRPCPYGHMESAKRLFTMKVGSWNCINICEFFREQANESDGDYIICSADELRIERPKIRIIRIGLPSTPTDCNE